MRNFEYSCFRFYNMQMLLNEFMYDDLNGGIYDEGGSRVKLNIYDR